jgi:hypothetical protein
MDNHLKCPNCKKRPKQKHQNAKWCLPCALEFRHRPQHKLSLSEQARVRRLAGTMSRDNVAKRVGRSLSSIRRFCRTEGISLMFERDYSEAERKEVCEYYSTHGKVETKKKFPNVKLRSIVERYLKKYGTPRQVRWTAEQLVELAKMGGVISAEAQANYFNRPRAFRGSIRAAWIKRFGTNGGCVHGVKSEIAGRLVAGAHRRFDRHYGSYWVIPLMPLHLPLWCERQNFKRKKIFERRIFLWVDIARHLREDLPEEHRNAVKAMARFQEWLLGTTAVRKALEQMILEREIKGGKNESSGRIKKNIECSGVRTVQYKVGDKYSRRPHEQGHL